MHSIPQLCSRPRHRKEGEKISLGKNKNPKFPNKNGAGGGKAKQSHMTVNTSQGRHSDGEPIVRLMGSNGKRM